MFDEEKREELSPEPRFGRGNASDFDESRFIADTVERAEGSIRTEERNYKEPQRQTRGCQLNVGSI